MSLWEALALNFILITALATAAYAGYRAGRMSIAPVDRPNIPLPVSEEERRRTEKFGSAFKDMMEYDVTRAMESKKARLTDGE